MKNNKICFSKEKTLVIVGVLVMCALVIKVATVVNVNQQSTSTRAEGPHCSIENMTACGLAVNSGDCEFGTCKTCMGGRATCTFSTISTDEVIEFMNLDSGNREIVPLAAKPLGMTDEQAYYSRYDLQKDVRYWVTSISVLDREKLKHPNLVVISQTFKCDQNSTTPTVTSTGDNISSHFITAECKYKKAGYYSTEHRIAYRMLYGPTKYAYLRTKFTVK